MLDAIKPTRQRIPREPEPSGPRKPRAPKSRSAVTNLTRLHVEPPSDNAYARRFRDVLFEIISDIGGSDTLSEGQRQIARRCATLAIECERMESAAASGNEIDVDRYGQMTDRMGRAFQRLGLRRQARDATLSLGEMIRQDQLKKQEEARHREDQNKGE